MNQILQNKITASSNKRKNKSKQKIFRLQFFSSIILFIIIVEIYLLNLQARNKEENTTKQIANNYNITRLYNNNSFESETYNQNGHFFTVIGMIEIPKISIYYPIISESNDELLKISPCRISGPMPNEDGNLCIAGHNYDNYKFFSKLSSLKIDDEIVIHNMDGEIFNYKVFKIYEVPANDLSPLDNIKGIKKQVTLITCNNFNSFNRIVIKASVI